MTVAGNLTSVSISSRYMHVEQLGLVKAEVNIRKEQSSLLWASSEEVSRANFGADADYSTGGSDWNSI